MINVIFLDIDNVLNYGAFTTLKTETGEKIKVLSKGLGFDRQYGFAPELVENLKYIINNTENCKIVISSSWRLNSIMEYVSKELNWRICLEDMLGMKGVIIDDIPTINEFPKMSDYTNKRGEDIKLWLDMYKESKKVKNFVILDDFVSCGTIPKLFPHNSVICDEIDVGEGLSKRNAKKAIEILK